MPAAMVGLWHLALMVFRFRTAIHMMCGNLRLHPPTSQSFRLQDSTVLEKTWLLSAQFHQACCSWPCGCHRRGNVIRIFCDGCVANSDTPVAKMATFQSLGHLKQC
mmetsp:Transcript_37983/g.81668  ORF Transcript_37983/g.81668 Transcript_37983/m.81668 type:complete len:106 (-) Transcript_37983:63-380(-)